MTLPWPPIKECYCQRCSARRRNKQKVDALAERERLWRTCDLCVAEIPHLWHPLGEAGAMEE